MSNGYNTCAMQNYVMNSFVVLYELAGRSSNSICNVPCSWVDFFGTSALREAWGLEWLFLCQGRRTHLVRKAGDFRHFGRSRRPVTETSQSDMERNHASSGTSLTVLIRNLRVTYKYCETIR
jgi:hypothetical protein